jgi:hypothetical protein
MKPNVVIAHCRIFMSLLQGKLFENRRLVDFGGGVRAWRRELAVLPPPPRQMTG